MAIYAYIRDNKNEGIQLQIESVVQRGYDYLEVSLNEKKNSMEALGALVWKMVEKDGLLVPNLACLGLRSKKLYEFLTLLDEKKIFLVSIEEKIDTREKSGQHFYQALEKIYRMERTVISESTLAAIVEARKDGSKIGRPKIDIEKVNEIRYLYRTKNISMRQISKLVGISVGSVSKYIRESEL